MASIEPKILKGFRDYAPDKMIARQRMARVIADVFERFGFAPLETPVLEYSEILLGKYGGETDKQVYRFLDNGKRDVCMRFDLTVPLARFVAMNRSLPKPFKRYQLGNVWRAENPGRGRFREFMQCDVDVVGTESLLADAECLAAAYQVMRELDIQVTVQVNNRKIFRALQELLEIEAQSTMDALLRALDKINKIGEEGVRKELEEQVKITASQIERCFEFLRIQGSNEEVLEKLSKLFANSHNGMVGIKELKEISQFAQALGVPEDAYALVPSLVRGADYYTGTIFEIALTELPGFGSVAGGGRYDDLVSVYTKERLPAVGISIGFDRLLAGLEELGKIDSASSPSVVCVTVFAPESQAYSMKIAKLLRDSGIATEMTLDSKVKLKAQLKYVAAKGIPFVVIAGPDEEAAESVTLKDMTSGEQVQLELEQLSGEVRKRIAPTS